VDGQNKQDLPMFIFIMFLIIVMILWAIVQLNDGQKLIDSGETELSTLVSPID
jgi:hypothetical protein